MQRKLLFILLSVIIFVLILSVSASAEKYKINFDNKGTVETDENGTITLKDTPVYNLDTTVYKIKDKDGNEIEATQQFLGWYTEDGRTFDPGEIVTFTEDTRLYQASGVVVYNYADLTNLLGRGWWCVKLGADIVAEKNISTCNGKSGTMSILDLNGHNITTSSSQAFGEGRSGLMIVGEGTITHTGTGNFFATSYHSYNPDNIRVSVGQYATVISNAMLFYANDVSPTSGLPKVKIWGNVTAKGLLNVDKSTNAVIGIYEGANVVLTGSDPMMFRNEEGINIYANIELAGNITLTDPNAVLLDNFIMTNKFEIKPITSGSFTVNAINAERLAMFVPSTFMLKSTENGDGTVTYSVASADCIHQWQYSDKDSVKATLDATGIDVYQCNECGEKKQTITVYMPSEVIVTVIVRTENGDVEYSLPAGEVYDFKLNGIGADALCYIAGLKDTESFTASQIVEISIPLGVVEFEGFENETVEVVTILDGAVIKLQNLSTMRALREIVIGASTVTFGTISTSSKIEAINSNVAGATVTFNSSSFHSVTSIKNLNMSAGSTYNFGGNSFYHSGLTRVVFPDNSNVAFTGDAAFYGSPNLEYVYFGENCISDKKITRKPFDCCYSIKTIILMDIVYIDQYTFCCNGSASTNADHREGKGLNSEALVVYSHANNISFHENVFANRGVLGVKLYTVDTNITSLKNCVYTIYLGIGHNYSLETVVPSTCVTEGTAYYVTDCPCANDYREVSYTTYSTLNAELNEIEHQPFGTDVTSLPLSSEHTSSDIIKSVAYENGFYNFGTKTFKCLYCDEAVSTEEEPSFPIIFKFNGYSVPENGKLAITVGYSINIEALNSYNEINNTELEIGVVGVIAEKLGGKTPHDSTLDGVPVIDVKVDNRYSTFDFIIGGFNETQLDLALVMCAYVYDGAKYVYLQETQADNPYSVTLSSYMN